MHVDSESKRWSRGQLEDVTRCPACGSNRRSSLIFKRRDNEGAMLDLWRMVQCGECQSLWLDPRPDVESLPRAYDDYYTHHAEVDDIPESGAGGLAWKLIHGYLNRRFGICRQPAAAWGYPALSLIEPWRLKLDYYGRHLTRNRVGKPGRLLDIGCGNGAFLSRAAEMGWQVQGCEIDPKAVATCRAMGIEVVEGDAFSPALTGNTYGVITVSHVIEHVRDQPALLQRAYDLLRPGGWLWLACPNPNSIGLHVSGAAWHALHPPYHLCIPSQSVLLGWVKEKRFSNIQLLRRGSHVRNVWKVSQAIALQETIVTLPEARLFAWRIIADALATLNPYKAEETVFLAQKPE